MYLLLIYMLLFQLGKQTLFVFYLYIQISWFYSIPQHNYTST
jgi:hypothetical protein